MRKFAIPGSCEILDRTLLRRRRSIGLGEMAMKTKDVKRANRPSLSNETLATEIKTAQTQFEMSCHWLVSLAEHLEHFPNDVMDAVEMLEKMQRQARQGKSRKELEKSCI